jgi:hypothetical protein
VSHSKGRDIHEESACGIRSLGIIYIPEYSILETIILSASIRSSKINSRDLPCRKSLCRMDLRNVSGKVV